VRSINFCDIVGIKATLLHPYYSKRGALYSPTNNQHNSGVGGFALPLTPTPQRIEQAMASLNTQKQYSEITTAHDS
jgi:hypothetical protein